MLKDKLKATDWEATDETLTEIVAKESYLQWLKENQRRHKPPSSVSNLMSFTDTFMSELGSIRRDY